MPAANGPLTQTMRRIRALAGEKPAADAELLERFVQKRDEAAFAELVTRHGPLVLGVARRWLSDRHEADDVVQATFLALAKQARRLDRRKPLTGWLYTVAYRLARKAQARASRRDRLVVSRGPSNDPLAEITGRELTRSLEEELAKLPERYRAPLLLCALDGLSRDEAATQLGITLDAIRGRLERGREMLRKRLEARGLTLPAALAGVLVADGSPVISATFAAAVTQAALAAPTISGMKLTAVAAAVLVMLGTGAGLALREDEKAKAPENKTPFANASGSPAVRVDREGVPLPEGAVARLGTTRFRHEGEASSVVYSPNGKFLAAMSADGTIILWRASTGQEFRRLRGLPHHIVKGSLIAFSPDSMLIAGPETGKSVALWSLETGVKVRTIVLPEVADNNPEDGPGIHTIRISPDSKTVAVSGNDISYLLELDTGRPRQFLKGSIGGLCFSPDGQSVVFQSINLKLRMNDLHCRSVRTLAALWQTAIPPGPDHQPGRSEELICELAFSPDGRTLATAGTNRILLWETGEGKHLATLESKMGQVKNIAFTPDGRHLLAGGEESGKVHVWELESRTEKRQLDPRQRTLRAMALSPDGRTVACGSEYGTICLCDLASGKDLFADQPGHDAQVNSVAFSRDGNFLVSGGENKQIWIWDAATRKPVSEYHAASPRQVAFSSDGKRLGLLSPGIHFPAKHVDVWDATTGKPIFHLQTNDYQSVNALAFSNDREWLVTAGLAPGTDEKNSTLDCRLAIWNSETGKAILSVPLPGIRPRCLALSPAGTLAAIGGISDTGKSRIRLCDFQKGKELLGLPIYQHNVTCLSFSSDGGLLASGSSDSTVRVWEVCSGREVFAHKKDAHAIRSIVFCPNQRIVASASGLDRPTEAPSDQDGIRLWDVLTGNELQHLRGYNSTVTTLAFSPDGSRLASGLRNSTVLLWQTPSLPSVDQRAALGPQELESLWTDLAGHDTAKARRAISTFVGGADEVVSFMSRLLKPTRLPDVERVQQLIRDLDNDSYSIRLHSARLLAESGSLTAPLIRAALAKEPNAQMKRQLETLLETVESTFASGSELQSLRAVEILEHIATPAAREHLRTLADGAPGARLTEAAASALKRNEKKG